MIRILWKAPLISYYRSNIKYYNYYIIIYNKLTLQLFYFIEKYIQRSTLESL